MPLVDDFPALSPWLENQLGHALDKAAQGHCAVLPGPAVDEPDRTALLAYRIGRAAIIRVPETWLQRIRSVVADLSLDEVFSVFGAYELSRVTLEEGVGVWGPSWYYFADRDSFVSGVPTEAVQLDAAAMQDADPDVFWHCDRAGAAVGFGVFEQGRLVALAGVRDIGAPVYEIDVDVAPANGRRGLGRAVMGAAGRWILERGGLPLARTAPWNVPSARLLRSLGMRYTLCDMVGTPGPFRVPPQPLGKPTPEARMYNLYPAWAMNKNIEPKNPAAG